ncbi:hypothetical protein GJ629_03785 [Halapricum sp. CBA1109]|uniref:hypothetical protein n=1 Tax=Halapricum sp. CBA1109 TaxID=2668068 RepID=UPI0012F93A70|nr:hypothetical protein [Halapricum sp. CBA1109]MUV89130.1 hypothetical protein [Halapricum sp. CBA1109]
MTRQSLISRRRMLTAVGVGATIALAGCSGNSQEGSGNGENKPENTQTETESPTENTGGDTTESQDTETPTETGSQFSTEGNDSELITRSPEELVLTESDLPREDYSVTSSDGTTSPQIVEFYKVFESEEGRLENRTRKYDEGDRVSLAEEFYDHLPRNIGGSIVDQTELDIAVESKFLLFDLDNDLGYLSYIKFRDANAVSILSWITENEPVGLQEIGSLAVTLHQSWR